MANEGIMSLPTGLDMQGAQDAQPPAPTVSSADSYDAANIALGSVDPQAKEAAKQALREAIGDLQLTPEQLDLMIQVFEYVSNNPAEYESLVQTLIQEGIADPGDFPEQYDPQFIGMLLMVLNEMRMMQGQGAMEPMQMGPAMEGLEPIAMAEGGLADVAAYLAAQGRNGDTMLAHITPEEAEMLKARGGSGTINPVTGLPEFFIKKVFRAVANTVKRVVSVVKKAMQSPVGRILGTIALATVLGPASMNLSLGSTAAASAAINAGLAGAGATLLGGGNLKEALVAGAMGYIGGGGTIMGANPMSAVGQYLPGAAGSALNTGLSTGLIGAGIGKLGGMSTQDALRMGMMSGASAAALQGLRNNTTLLDGRVTADDIRQRAQEGFRQSEIAAQNAGPIGPVGPVGTASNLMAPVESLDFGGTAQAARFEPFAPQGAGTQNYAQRLAYEAAQKGDFGRVAELQQQFPGEIRGQYSHDLGRGVRSYSMATTDPVSKFTQVPLEFNPASVAAPAAVAPGALPVQGAQAISPYSPLQLPPGAAAEPNFTVAGGGEQGLFSRITEGAKGLYNEYLSPSRPGLPADAGILRKYGPLMAAGTAVASMTGATKATPSDPNPIFNRAYTGTDYLRDNPGRFQGGLDFSYVSPAIPQSPVVQTDFSRSIPITQPGQVMPMGATMSPTGIMQPYNVSGLYGVPLIYPVNRAKGGEMSMTEFPRKTGPINGPGTGTSDSIPAMLSDGEFVFTARAVRNAGGGSRRKGAARMYKLMKKLEGGAVKG